MNILYVEFYEYGKLKYSDCHLRSSYGRIYTRLESWGNRDLRKMNLLAIF